MARTAPRNRSRVSAVVLSAVFTLTGIATPLLGAALPALLVHWRLSDRDAGSLFFLAWLGAALGALLSRGDYARSVQRGIGLTAAASLALAHARGFVIYPLTLCYGLGLGITMTSLSLLRARRAGARRPQELNRLNLLWALGALCCPAYATHALRTSRPGYLFLFTGLLFAFAGAWVLYTERAPARAQAEMTFPSTLPSVPHLFCAVSGLIVGVEASLGAWLTTYLKRTDGTVRGAVTAATAFWAGLLLSRALHSLPRIGRIEPATLLRVYGAILAVALLFFSTGSAPAMLLTLAFVLGFALGPLYPLLLAATLARYRGNRVFLSAGLGAALLPWLTGMLSGAAGSLRIGLLVPCFAGCLLAFLVWRVPWQARQGEQALSQAGMPA